MEVRDIKKIMPGNEAAGGTFINRAASTIVHRDKCLGAAELLVPARYHSVLADEDELSRQRIRTVAHLKKLRVVRDDAGRIRAVRIGRAGRNGYHQTVSRIRK